MPAYTWGDILDHCAIVHLDDRAAMLEGANDEEFSDETLLKYLAQAQEDLSREAWCIYDSDTASTGDSPNEVPLCEVPLVDGQREYRLHPSILGIEDARFSDTDVLLVQVTKQLATPGRTWSTNPGSMYPSIVVDNPGRPVWYETQSAPLRLSFNVKTELAQFDGTIHPIQQGPTPAVLKLRVYRMPILPVTPDTLDEYPEVGWEHHLNLALFAAGKALTTSRSEDAESKRIGSNLTKEWLKVVADAKRDRLRRQTPTPRFRRGGWAGRANSSNV